MPRSSLAALVDELDDASGRRYLDMRLDVERCQCPLCWRMDRPPERLLYAGGRWDRSEKRYLGEAEAAYREPPPQTRRLYLQDAQLAAGRWFASWLAARQRGSFLMGPDGEPCFAVGFVGGRRSGKSDLVEKLPLTYALAMPRSILWLVVPTFPDMPEIQRAIEEQLPRDWYDYRGDPWYSYELKNGSVVEIKSSYDPEDLRRGRCDLAVIHEAQKHQLAAYEILRPAAADKGGLVMLAANPPKNADGEWVTDFVDRARSQKTDEVVFEFDPRKNPHVVQQALTALKKVMDTRTYQRDVLGLFLPREDLVFYAYSDAAPPLDGNVRPIGTDAVGRPLRDVTRAFLAKHFGAPADNLHGMDFQKTPHMVSTVMRFFEDPADPAGFPLTWYTDCVLVEDATEDDLVNALHARGYSGVPAEDGSTGGDVVVMDASGDWQDAERTRGRASADMLRRRGWRRLYLPDAKTKRNPMVSERVAVMNSLFRDANGKRRAFVAPHVVEVRRAFRSWETREGAPSRRSIWTHVCDAASYPPYRLFPRRVEPPRPGRTATLIARPKRGGWEDMHR